MVENAVLPRRPCLQLSFFLGAERSDKLVRNSAAEGVLGGGKTLFGEAGAGASQEGRKVQEGEGGYMAPGKWGQGRT